jgi:hypothetical protein
MLSVKHEITLTPAETKSATVPVKSNALCREYDAIWDADVVFQDFAYARKSIQWVLAFGLAMNIDH